jgi:hypothetical protein
VLSREEYIEQAYFFRTLRERMLTAESTQELLRAVRDEILSTTKLPLAIDFLAAELNLYGVFSPAMAKLPHYFTPFQTFVIAESEDERGRFDFRVALEILEREADYRGEGTTPQGMFLYQFECLCRNRLSYDRGLGSMSDDPIFNDDWKSWILTVRRQIGIVEIADLIYVRSQHYANANPDQSGDSEAKPILFAEKEGRIALANRKKDPLYLFAALQRQLGYPTVPRPRPVEDAPGILASLSRQVQRMEARLKLLEEEQRGGIDITKFYGESGREPS